MNMIIELFFYIPMIHVHTPVMTSNAPLNLQLDYKIIIALASELETV